MSGFKTKKPADLGAAFTVEAAVVVSVALIAMISLIKWDFYLHDTIVSASTANEAVELYGHLGEGNDISEIDLYENERLKLLFSGREYSLSMETYKDGSRVSLTGAEGTRVYEDGGFKPEDYMRKLTILEEVIIGD